MPEPGVAVLRAASWLVPAAAVALTLTLRPPRARSGAAAIVSTCWCLVALLALNDAASSRGWWRFHADGGLLANMPIETWLGWATAWGALPALALPRIRIAPILVAVGAWDWIAMPRLAPLLELGEEWLAGEAVALACVLAPGLWLTRLTLEDRAVVARAALQCAAFTGMTFWLLPVVALSGEPDSFAARIAERGAPHPALVALGGPFVLLALAALGEFAVRGGGTPLPLDPPRRLVTTGPYAFISNPMQLGASTLLALEAAWLDSLWLALAVPLSVAYSAGFAAFDENTDMRERFGAGYGRYRAAVRAWIPRWRPHRDRDATLYFGAGCDLCEDFARFLLRLAPTHLAFVPAQQCETRVLTRLTYRDGAYEAAGVRALARAFEHTTLPLALLGFAMRAPVVATMLQWLADASGGGPRELPRAGPA
jgi:protein-S-isoprenylcysteine O-methyltransferase Ste14